MWILFPFELLALVYFVLLPVAVILTGGARRRGPWRAMAAGAALATVIVIAVRVLSPMMRMWLGHLYLVAGYWMPALATAGTGETPFEQWLKASDARWRSRLDAAPAWLVQAGDVAYLLCYPLVPAAFLVVWIVGNNLDLNRFWLAVLIGGFAGYGSLPWLAARPPRLLPGARAPAHPIARVNVGLLSRVSHNLTTCPSGHVGVSIAAALCVATVSPVAGLTCALVAVAISIGAVTGGYHFVMDVAIGAAVGAVSALVAITAVAEAGPQSAPAAVVAQSADTHEPRRIEMVERQIASRGVTAPPVLDAMRTVPRERFVPPEVAWRAYDDSPVPIGLGQTISQPYIVAYMSELLRTAPHHRVLEIGTGSGYPTPDAAPDHLAPFRSARLMPCHCAHGWICGKHPAQPWPHDDCSGPGERCDNRECPRWKGPVPAALDTSDWACAQYRTTTTSTHPANVTNRLSVFDVSSISPTVLGAVSRRREGKVAPASICVAARGVRGPRGGRDFRLTKNGVPGERAVERCVDRRPRDVYGRRSRQDRRQPVGAVHRPLGGE